MNNTTLVAAALATALSLPVGAAQLAADSTWTPFDVDALTSQSGGLEWIDLDGAALAFTFTLTRGGILRVVDAGFRGDVFQLTLDDGVTIQALAPTSTVANPDISLETPELDFDAAFANPLFSSATFHLAPGSYSLTGTLTQSANYAGEPLNATIGAVALTAVPVPAAGLLLLGGSGLLAAFARRRS